MNSIIGVSFRGHYFQLGIVEVMTKDKTYIVEVHIHEYFKNSFDKFLCLWHGVNPEPMEVMINDEKELLFLFKANLISKLPTPTEAEEINYIELEFSEIE